MKKIRLTIEIEVADNTVCAAVDRDGTIVSSNVPLHVETDSCLWMTKFKDDTNDDIVEHDNVINWRDTLVSLS